MKWKQNLLVGSLSTLVLAVAVVGFTSIRTYAAGQDIEAAFEKAQIVRQNMIVPPGSYHGGVMPQTMQTQILASARANLNTVFTPSMVQNELKVVQNAIAEQSTNAPYSVISLGGGVSNFDINSVQLNGDTATISAVVTAWAKMAQVQPDGSLVVAQPHNDLDVTATLVQNSSGQWQVSQEQWTFAPGSAP